MPFKYIASLPSPAAVAFLFFLFPVSGTAACLTSSRVENPNLLSIGWLPRLADLAGWDNYNPRDLPGAGRLLPSSDGKVSGMPLRSPGNACDALPPGTYNYVMRLAESEAASQNPNFDMIYLRQQQFQHDRYLRLPKLASGLPSACGGTFTVDSNGELATIDAAANHRRCLEIAKQKISDLGIYTISCAQ